MLSDVKFVVTNTRTGDCAVISLDDLYAYEGEVCGILIRSDGDRNYIPKSLQGEPISFNSGYGMQGDNEDIIVTKL